MVCSHKFGFLVSIVFHIEPMLASICEFSYSIILVIFRRHVQGLESLESHDAVPCLVSALTLQERVFSLGFSALPSHFCGLLFFVFVSEPVVKVTLWHGVGVTSHALTQCKKAVMSLREKNKIF